MTLPGNTYITRNEIYGKFVKLTKKRGLIAKWEKINNTCYIRCVILLDVNKVRDFSY